MIKVFLKPATFKKLLSIILIIIFYEMTFAQSYPIIDGVPRDTSFNPESAFRKAQKDYPFIKLVKQQLPEGVIAFRNVTYLEFDKRKLKLDICRPDYNHESGNPAVLLIHGGGWASGSKEHLVPMSQRLAEKGFVTAAVEYRLSPEAKYPAGIKDLKTAVKWMKANCNRYNIDTNKIAVIGCSAGATLASILGTTTGVKDFESEDNYKQYSAKVHAVINMDGILDFTHPAESCKDTIPGKLSAGTRWFGQTYNDNPDVWKEASPVNYVDKNTPPFLFVNSSLDRFHAGREIFISKLNSHGIYYEVNIIPDTPHPFWLFHPWFESVLELSYQFLVKVFNIH